MKLLLDTHIWIWWMADPARLPADAAKAIRHPQAERWVSVVSLWETHQLQAKGRIAITGALSMAVAQQQLAGATRFQPINVEIALAMAEMPLELRDPADRWLLATARVEGMRLITADRQLRRFMDG